MSIKDLITRTLWDTYCEPAQDQAEAVIATLQNHGFLKFGVMDIQQKSAEPELPDSIVESLKEVS